MDKRYTLYYTDRIGDWKAGPSGDDFTSVVTAATRYYQRYELDCYVYNNRTKKQVWTSDVISK